MPHMSPTMRLLYKTVLTLAFLTLFQLLSAATTSPSAASNTAPEYYPEKCGNMAIHYPFGIEEGRFREGFQVICDEATGTASTVDGVEIMDMLHSQAQLRVCNYVGYSCHYPDGENNQRYKSYLDLRGQRYTLSNTHNKFTAVGCQNLATISDPYGTRSTDNTDNPDIYGTGCLTLCTNQSRIVENSTCSGIGCCQLTIPTGLSYYEINFDPGFLNKDIQGYSPCNYGFLAENDFYTFSKSDTECGNLLQRFEKAPLMLDWVVGNENCKEAKLNKTGDYACVSRNSTCKDSENGSGYTCSCEKGYDGNPYIEGGCSN